MRTKPLPFDFFETGAFKAKARDPNVGRRQLERGHLNEQRIINALTEDPGPDEAVPPWFIAARGATLEEDRKKSTDFYVLVSLESTAGGHAPNRQWVPVNAKSSSLGLHRMRSNANVLKREARDHVPIVGFVVRDGASSAELRGNFFSTFPRSPALAAWLRSRRFALASEREDPHLTPEARRARRHAERARQLVLGEIGAGVLLSVAQAKARLAELAEAAVRLETGRGAARETRAAFESLRADAEILEAARAWRATVEDSLNGAYVEAAAIDALTPAEAVPRQVGEIFGRSFMALRATHPLLVTPKVWEEFLETAKRAVADWRRAAARAIAQGDVPLETQPAE